MVIRTKRRGKIGIVVSNKMDKTIVVKIERLVKHPVYGKIVRRSSQFKVHDKENIAKVGDRVRVVETRPLSKDKNWRIVEILKNK